MILFKKDWLDTQGHARAIVHADTKNRSFRRMAAIYAKMGIQNNLFHLALTQPDLAKYDPHNLTDPSIELRLRIAHECQINIWYYLREVVRIPVAGGEPISFEAHRGNISMAWAYGVGIDYMSVQPRQTGKTIGAIAITSHVIYFKGRNFTMAMLTKDTNLRQENVSRLKEMRDALPQYLIHSQSVLDTDNKEGLVYNALNNEYMTFVAQKDRQAASNVGRGQSIPSLHVDEKGYCSNIRITFPVIQAATTAAGPHAKRNGMPSTNIYTTTAAAVDGDSGKFAFERLTAAMPFTEKLYDCEDAEAAIKMVKFNSTNNMLNGSWSYLQLGRTHEWFVDTIAKVGASEEEVERDFLNIWRAGSERNVISKDILAKMKASQSEPRHIQILQDYAVYWYIPESEVNSTDFRNRPFIIGMDSSEGIGKDFTALVMICPFDMRVKATFRCNESNIPKLGMFIGNLLVKYPKAVFIPERKSTGLAIIDTVSMILLQNQFNPFTRIFNRVIQNRDKEGFRDINIYDKSLCDSAQRKYLGFITDGKSRPFLYKQVLNKAVKMNAERIYDQGIITELSGLSVINGRVDHKDGGHDDLAIAYLLACWFLFEGRNLGMYGLPVDQLLSRAVEITGGSEDPRHKADQLMLRKKIQHYETLAESTNSPMMKHHFRSRANVLREMVDDSMTVEPIIVDQLASTMRTYGDIYNPDKSDRSEERPLTRVGVARLADAARAFF